MDVVDDGLAERGEVTVDLIGHEKLIAVQIAVCDRDPPFVSPEIRQLGFALSPQTGGCESDRGSALGERLSRKNDQPDADRQDCHRVNAHRTSLGGPETEEHRTTRVIGAAHRAAGERTSDGEERREGKRQELRTEPHAGPPKATRRVPVWGARCPPGCLELGCCNILLERCCVKTVRFTASPRSAPIATLIAS